MILVKVTRKRRKGITSFCPLGALQVAVIYLTLTMMRPKSSGLLEISSAGLSGEGDGLPPL
jgi:hypothetical protein